ncbi:hypothetical protein K450DRAFT_262017 [Umbelopsis ramanniana AG]|uniref:Zn(2)-C6 fungal-type domain-containing protein n=1 Tax=Umbelopsis ramanniana AG TaxID=1314678 RepID=A0AAD5E2V1_UMBRA|nr:uncharacterized protein K450DRAFT_262017 [Umbelopsis ramanniana AG]KAI8575390.1 hypothetical protein K450DRAFT_262017 [Umbelopsis ramanniana AG]
MTKMEASAAMSPAKESVSSPGVDSSKASTSGKRAKTTRACDECRKRKVKCDGAYPCQRCNKNETPCVFAKLPPKRGPPKQYVEILETRLKLIEKALKEIDGSKQFMGLETNVDSQEEDWAVQHVLEDTDQQEQAWETESWVMLNSDNETISPSLLEQKQRPDQMTQIFDATPHTLSVNEIGQGLYVDDRQCRTDRIPSMYSAPSSVFSEKSTSAAEASPESASNDLPLTMYHLEPEPLPPRKVIGPNTLSSNMPALIETYFKYVHKYVPIIHKPNFLKQMQNKNNPPSLILLNAMCAVAARWHEASDANAGPPGVTFYQKAFALIDDHFDVPRISTIQALLLLIKYQEQHHRSGYFFRPYMFMGMVTRMCDDIGLSRTQGRCMGDAGEIEMRKRTFWVAYMYDLLMSVEQGRKPHFTSNECDQEFPNATAEEGPELEDIISNHNVLIQLSKIMGEIYRLARLIAFRKGRPRSMLEVVEEQGKLFVLHTHLENFLHELPATLAYTPTTDPYSYPADKHQISDSFVGFLHMQYHFSIILLHRPYMMSPLPEIGTEFTPYLHRDLCASSASHITNIAQILLDKDDINEFFYPTRGVQHTIHFVIASATVHQSKAMQSYDGPDHEIAKQQYLTSMNILKALSKISPSQSFVNAIKDAELAHMYGRMAVSNMDMQGPQQQPQTPHPEAVSFRAPSRLQRSHSDLTSPELAELECHQTPNSPASFHSQISQLASRANKRSPNSSSMLRHSSAVMSDPLNYAALMHQQQGEAMRNINPPNYIDRYQQFARPLGHSIGMSQDDLMMPSVLPSMLPPAPVPNRSQSTNRLIPSRPRSWVQKAVSGFNVIPYKPKRDGISKLSNISPSTSSSNPRNKNASPQRGLSPAPSRTNSTPRVAPYGRPVSLGHHRRHTISAVTSDQESETQRYNQHGRPHTWTSAPGPSADLNLMLNIATPLNANAADDMRESMMVDSNAAADTDDSMVQLLMNDSLQWDMLPQ